MSMVHASSPSLSTQDVLINGWLKGFVPLLEIVCSRSAQVLEPLRASSFRENTTWHRTSIRITLAISNHIHTGSLTCMCSKSTLERLTTLLVYARILIRH